MDFELNDAQRMLRDMVRDFAEKEIKPRAAEIDRTDEFPWDLWKRMAELGILGMTLPPGPSRKRRWRAPRSWSPTFSSSAR
jgi:alkylation response protein AidB-like acyl-CoA dehydrogenase